MANNNALIGFLRTYGPTASSNTMYDEHVLRASEKYGVDPISQEPPRLADVVQNFEAIKPHSIILTGTAGDGKTYHCRMAYLRLGGNTTEYTISNKMLDWSLPISGKTLRIIKDLSDMSEAEKEAELEHIGRSLLGHDTDRVYLIAANDGQLLKFWRDFADRHAAYRGVEKTLRGMLKDEQETDPKGLLQLRMINLSRQSHHRLFDQLRDQIINHPMWVDCESCAVVNDCPIRMNRALLSKRGDATLRGRVADLIRLAAANDAHFPVRQLLILIVNTLLGDDSPGDNLLTCQKARNRLGTPEDGYRATNPYQNVFGLNLRPRIRDQYHAFRTLGAFGIGRETSNAIDDYLVYRASPDDQGALPEKEARYGATLFEPSRQAYLRGDLESFESFRHAIEAQRRRLFFDMPSGRSNDTNPWRLTIFQHGGDYLKFMDHLAEEPGSVGDLKSEIVLGLNRTFTGMLCDNREALWVASPAANGYDRRGRVLECPPIPIGEGRGSLLLLFADFDVKGLSGRPRVTIIHRLQRDDPLAVLEIRPLLFEYLLRVADGSLPSSFSRQCYEEVRQFRLKLVSRLRLDPAATGLSSLSLVVFKEDSGKLQKQSMGFVETMS